MEIVYEKIAKNYKQMAIFAIVITVFLAFGMTKLKTRNNYDGELGENDPIIITNDYFNQFFGDKHVVSIGLKCESIYNSRTLQKIINISEDLRKIENVIDDDILSLSTMNNVSAVEDNIDVGPLLDTVPKDSIEIASLKEKIMNNPLINGRLVSKDGTATCIMATIEKGYDQARVFNQVMQIIEKYSGPEELYAVGEPIMQQAIDSGIQKDIKRLLPIALLMILLGFYIAFRKISGVLLAFGAVLLSIVWTLGIMGHSRLPITVVSSSIPILMIAISSSYGIHLLHAFYSSDDIKDARERIKYTLNKIGSAIFLAGITSALGSITLVVFKLVSIKEFGIITTAGILSSLIISFTMLPALIVMAKTKKNKNKASEIITTLLKKVTVFSIEYRYLVLSVTFVIILISIVGIMRIKVGFDFVKYFPEGHSLRKAISMFDKDLGGSRYFNIMFETSEGKEVYNADCLKKMEEFQKYAESLPNVEYTNSISNIIKNVNKTMHGDSSEYYRIPVKQADISQYLMLYSLSAKPGEYNGLIDSGNRRAKILIKISSSDQEVHKAILNKLQSYTQTHFDNEIKVHYGGMLMLQIARIRHLVIGKIWNIITAIAVVFVVCALVFRSFVTGMIIITPLTLGTLIVFGCMGFLGIRIEMSTAIITSISVGIGVDFAIHFMMKFWQIYNENKNISEACILTNILAGPSIIFDMNSNIMGFIVFIFSAFTPVKYFGWLVSLTMLAIGLSTLLVLPSIIYTFAPTIKKIGERRLMKL